MPPRKKFQSRSVALPEQDRMALAEHSAERLNDVVLSNAAHCGSRSIMLKIHRMRVARIRRKMRWMMPNMQI